MPAIESAALVKSLIFGAAGFGFAGFAMTWDPVGVATGIAGGMTIIGIAFINLAKTWEKSNAGKTRAALKAKNAEVAGLTKTVAKQEAAIAKQEAEIARLNIVVDNWFKLWMERKQNGGQPAPDPRTFNPADPQ